MNSEALDVATSRAGIQSVDLALRVLEALIALGRPAPLGAIAAEAGIPSSQLHRYLVSFVRSGLAVQLESGAYDLGPTLRRYGIAAIQRMPPYEIVAERVRALRDETDVTVFLAVWADGRATILRWDAGSHHLPISFRLGSALPLARSATGRLFVALLPPAMTARALADESPDADFAARLDQIRASDLSASSDEILPGVDAYSVPVRDYTGDLFAAMTMLIPRGHVADGASCVERLRSTARASSALLGAVAPR